MAKKAAVSANISPEHPLCPRCRKPFSNDELQQFPHKKEFRDGQLLLIPCQPDCWCSHCRKNPGVDYLVKRLRDPSFSWTETRRWPDVLREIYDLTIKVFGSTADGDLDSAESRHTRNCSLARQLEQFIKGKKGGEIAEHLAGDPRNVVNRLRMEFGIPYPQAHFSKLFPQGPLTNRELQDCIVHLYISRDGTKSDLQILAEKLAEKGSNDSEICKSIQHQIRRERSLGNTTLERRD